MVDAPPTTTVDIGVMPVGATCWTAMTCVIGCGGEPACFEEECAVDNNPEIDALVNLLECTGFCTEEGCLNGCPEQAIECMTAGQLGDLECSFGVECGLSCGGDPFCERDCLGQLSSEAQLRYFLFWSCVTPICLNDVECQLTAGFDLCPKAADLCFSQP